MPKPRRSQVSLDATPYYHCVSRCVRRAFLCGTDTLSGHSYEHRRQWIEDKLYALSQVFALDLCAYAVMSNHYHVVLYIDAKQAESWSRYDVIERWHQLFNGTLFCRRHARGEALSKMELNVLDKDVAIWRQRLMDISWFMRVLMDISWFMRVLNEAIARQANTALSIQDKGRKNTVYLSNLRNPASSRMRTPSCCALSYFEPGSLPPTT